jgi:hypothetical protein
MRAFFMWVLRPPARFLARVLVALSAAWASVSGQAPTSASIAGRVVDRDGNGIAGVQLFVINRSTGSTTRAVSRAGGRYSVTGLDVGGPYTVRARRLGSPVATRDGFRLTLGEQRTVDIVLEAPAVLLASVEASAPRDRAFSRTHTGAEAFVSDAVLHHTPIINRDLYDLGRLVPQMSTWFAFSTPGAGPRVNSIRIDGVTDQVPSSNLAAGALYGGKVIPLDAVQEYQVLLSPFDVRHGGFAGASVNAVTRSGSNDPYGSAFAITTNERLGRDVPFVRNTRYDKQQMGFSLGAPIVRDRLLFFVATEMQQRSIPAAGPYLGQSAASSAALPVRAADIARFQQLLTGYGLSAGSAGAIANANPSSSTYLRFDAPLLSWNSRLSVSGSYGHADSSIFARPTTLAPTNCASTACFPLASLQHSRWVDKSSAAVHLNSNCAGGASNEFVVAYERLVSGFRPVVREPLILVSVPGTNGTTAIVQAGTHEIATGQRNVNWTSELSNTVSIPVGAHSVTFGVSADIFDLRAFQLRGAYGVWEFASLDSMEAGTAARYRVTRDTGSVTAASGAHYAAFLGDTWEPLARLVLVLGVRADGSVLSATPPAVPAIDTVFHMRTDRIPGRQTQWSPRVGFNYRLRAVDDPTQLRGGVGLFSGRPPLFWLFGGFSAYGLAERTLRCGSLSSDAGPAPRFSPDYDNPPMTCAGGQTFAAGTRGEVDVIDPNLRSPQTMRASLALDARLPHGVTGTIEGLYTRTTRSIFYAPINLRDPLATDAHGRTMYGTVGTSGLASPLRLDARFADVITISNLSRDYAYDLTGILRKHADFGEVETSLSYGHTRDVQSPRTISAQLTDNWRYARPMSGREDDLSLGTSDYDQTLRVRAFGAVRAPWRRFGTEISFIYVGGSGFPFTYVAGGSQGRGDLNADGVAGNDPLYVPRSALDTAEIRFAGTPAEIVAQQNAFEQFIEGAPCLRAQRGRIMTRNSCRSPWMHVTNLALRQGLPTPAGNAFQLEVQLFNVLNLLNAQWGRVQLPPGAVLATTSQFALLSQVAATPASEPIYRFDPVTPRFTADNVETYYQVQVGARYTF